MKNNPLDTPKTNPLQGPRPLLFFDIEATGLEIATDRIVSLAAMWRFEPSNTLTIREWLFNPGFKMSEEVIAIHGITNERVASAPTFKICASEILNLFRNCDLVGYNLRNFDVPILWEEFHRAGIDWNPNDHHIIDVSGIFRKKEPRDLAGALRFYCDAELKNAHSASADTEATSRVLYSQLSRYKDLGAMDRAQLAKFSHQDERLDLAGRIIKDDKGRIVYGFGKAKGVPVADDPGYGEWMLRQHWVSIETKRVLRNILRDQSMMEL